MEKKAKGFLVYYDNEIIVCRLDDEEAGKLFKSLFPYGRERITPNFNDNPALAMAFDILSMAINRGDELYKKRCETNKKNIEKRWSKKNSTVYDGIPKIPIEIEIEREIENNNITNYQEIISMYNDTCVSFPKVKQLSDKRKKAIKARLNTYTVDDFKKLFEMAESSSFLKGKNNRNWMASFDWLICDANMAKVLDGNYQDRDSRQQSTETNEPYSQ